MRAASARADAFGRARFRLTPRATILALLVAGLLLYMVGPLRTYLEQRERLVHLERQTKALIQANAGLEAQIRRLNDPEYLERLARERLGMVRPGEIGFVPVPEPSGTPPAGT